MTNRDRQPDQSFSRQRLLHCDVFVVRLLSLIVLLLVATSGTVLADSPPGIRTLNYEPVTAQQPGSPQSHVAAYPEPQADPPASRSSSGRNSLRTPDEALNTSLPELGGRIDDKQIQAVLDDINRKSQAAKSGATVTPPDNPPGTPATDDPGNTLPNSGFIFVERIVNIDDDWIAFKDGSRIPIPVIKSGDRFFTTDGNEVMRPDVPAATDEQPKESAKTTLADDQTRNALLLIVTTISVLAAFGIGILAFDYKHRWEQEIVSQNSRLLGSSASLGGVAHGTFTELDSLEPETLRFSLHDYGSPDDSFDHSFRTIA